MKLDQLKESVGSLWDSLADGWRQLMHSAAGALTRFKAGDKTNLPAEAEVDDQSWLANRGWAMLGGDVFEDETRLVVRLDRTEQPAHVALHGGQAHEIGAVGRLGEQMAVVARREGVVAERLPAFQRLARGGADMGTGAGGLPFHVPGAELPGGVEQGALDVLEAEPRQVELQRRAGHRAHRGRRHRRIAFVAAEAMPVQQKQQRRVGARHGADRDRVQGQAHGGDLRRDTGQDLHA